MSNPDSNAPTLADTWHLSEYEAEAKTEQAADMADEATTGKKATNDYGQGEEDGHGRTSRHVGRP